MSYRVVAAVAAGLLMAATAAEATTVTVTYTGTISSGFDGIGVFVPQDSDLGGLGFTAVFSVDDTVPADRGSVPGLYSFIIGGAQYGYPSSPVSADLTINGITVHIAGGDFGMASQLQQPYLGIDDVSHYAQDYWSNGGNQYTYTSVNAEIFSYTDLFLTSEDYHTPLSHIVQPDDNAWGFAGGGYFYSPLDNRNWYANLVPDSVEIVTGPFTAVPEPATLVLFGAGLFGAVRLRRR